MSTGKYSSKTIASKVRKRSAAAEALRGGRAEALSSPECYIPVERIVGWFGRHIKAIPKDLQRPAAEMLLDRIQTEGDLMFRQLFTLEGQFALVLAEQEADASYWLTYLVRTKGHELAENFFKSAEPWHADLATMRRKKPGSREEAK